MAKDPVCGMEVDEKKALRLSCAGKEHFFCSENCLEKFAKERRLSDKNTSSWCATRPSRPFYTSKTFIVSIVLATLVSISYIFPVLAAFRVSLFGYFKFIWWAILLGLFLGGLIDHYIPREYISYILARPGRSSIINAVILGFFMSACSHGILALSIQLHKKGASNPSVVAFLLASPWANMTITIMLIGFFGLKALYMIFAAIGVALVTGFIFQWLERRGLIERNANAVSVKEDFSIKDDLALRLKGYKFSFGSLRKDIRGIFVGAVSLGDMVLWWILIGIGIASLAAAYVPPHIFHNYMGPTVLGLMVTLFLATIIEICSEGSAPMAFEIFRQTGAFGNSFVFLMAGVVTDYTEIGLLWANVGRKTALWLPVVTVPQVIFLGFLANAIFK